LRRWISGLKRSSSSSIYLSKRNFNADSRIHSSTAGREALTENSLFSSKNGIENEQCIGLFLQLTTENYPALLLLKKAYY